jgi:hypothetical protein
VFRQALCNGESISDAATLALNAADDFDTGVALRELVNAGLVIAARANGKDMQ